MKTAAETLLHDKFFHLSTCFEYHLITCTGTLKLHLTANAAP